MATFACEKQGGVSTGVWFVEKGIKFSVVEEGIGAVKYGG